MLTKLFTLLTSAERKRAASLMAMILVMGFLDMVGVASILPFMTVLANPEQLQSNTLLHAVYLFSSRFGISTVDQFLLALGFFVLFLFVAALGVKALTAYAQARFGLMCEYSIGKRLVEGYLHQPYSWFLNRHSANLGKTILSEVTLVIEGSVIPITALVALGTVY